MSRINGEKARAAIARKRRTAQREKDRAARALMGTVKPAAAKPVAKPPAKVAAKPAVKAEAKPEAKPAAKSARKAKAPTA
jgi:hypothetical protein